MRPPAKLRAQPPRRERRCSASLGQGRFAALRAADIFDGPGKTASFATHRALEVLVLLLALSAVSLGARSPSPPIRRQHRIHGLALSRSSRSIRRPTSSASACSRAPLARARLCPMPSRVSAPSRRRRRRIASTGRRRSRCSSRVCRRKKSSSASPTRIKAATRGKSRSSTRRADRRSTPEAASSTATLIRKTRCIWAVMPVTSPARTSPFRATRSPATSVKAMAAAYENGKGSMAERLMDALDAGQSKGGDTRGMQSAGLLVVNPLAAELHEHGRTHRRSACGRCGESVQRIAPAAEHDAGRAEPADRGVGEAGRRGEIRASDCRAAEGARNQSAQRAVQYALAQRYAQAGDMANALKWLGVAISRQPKVWKPQAASDPLVREAARGRRVQAARRTVVKPRRW